MIYGHARVSTDGQSVEAQVRQLKKAGARQVLREVAGGAKIDRSQLRKVVAQLDALDVLMVTRLDPLARSTRGLLNTFAAIAGKKAGFKSLGNIWTNTATADGRLMLAELGGLAEFDRVLIRARTGKGRVRVVARGVRCEDGTQPEADRAPAEGSYQAARYRRVAARDCTQLQCQPQHNFHAVAV